MKTARQFSRQTVKTFLIFMIAFFVLACESDMDNAKTQSLPPQGGTTMGKFTEWNLKESTTSEDVTCEIVLTKIPDSISDLDEIQELWIKINDMPLAMTSKDFTPIQEGLKFNFELLQTQSHTGLPEVGKPFNPVLVFYNSDGEEICTATEEEITLTIKTWFLSTRQELNLAYQKFNESGEYEVHTESVWEHSRGNDTIYMYKVRIPEGEYITIGTEINYRKLPLIHQPHFSDYIGTALSAVHYRFYEYRFRELYPPEYEPEMYIDQEPDKWIQGPLTLQQGVYWVYVCPSELHDNTVVTIKTESSDGRIWRHKSMTRSINWPAWWEWLASVTGG
jgi:hypothetical protein